MPRIDLLTIGCMRNALKGYDSLSALSGHPSVNMLSPFNHDYFSHDTTVTATGQFYVTLPSSHTIHGVALFVNNYTDDLSDSGTKTITSIYGSGAFLIRSMTFPDGTDNNPVMLIGSPYSTGVSGTDFGIQYALASGTAFKVGMIFVYKQWTISVRNLLPEKDARTFRNRRTGAIGGPVCLQGGGSGGSDVLHRRFRLEDVSDRDALENAFRDSGGRRYPLIYVEDEDWSGARLMRFESDLFSSPQGPPGTYYPEVVFVQEPFILAGESI